MSLVWPSIRVVVEKWDVYLACLTLLRSTGGEMYFAVIHSLNAMKRTGCC